jgi:hypothetical protein
MNATELYTALAKGAPPPAALVEAQARVDQLADVHPEASLGSKTQDAARQDLRPLRSQGSVGVAQSAISAADFQTIYCNPASTYPIYDCKTDRTGNTGWIDDQDASLMQITGSPYRGSIKLELQYGNIWGWHDDGDVTAAQDEVWFVLGYGSKKERRARVYDATGDGYHREVHGNI